MKRHEIGIRNLHNPPPAQQLKLVQSVVKKGMASSSMLKGKSDNMVQIATNDEQRSTLLSAKLLIAQFNTKYSTPMHLRARVNLSSSEEDITSSVKDSSQKKVPVNKLGPPLGEVAKNDDTGKSPGVNQPPLPQEKSLTTSVEGGSTSEEIESIILTDVSEPSTQLSISKQNKASHSSNLIENIHSVTSLLESMVPSAEEEYSNVTQTEQSHGKVISALQSDILIDRSLEIISSHEKNAREILIQQKDFVNSLSPPDTKEDDGKENDNFSLQLPNVGTVEEVFQITADTSTQKNKSPKEPVIEQQRESMEEVIVPKLTCVSQTGTLSSSEEQLANSEKLQKSIPHKSNYDRGEVRKERRESHHNNFTSKRQPKERNSDIPTLKAVKKPDFRAKKSAHEYNSTACICSRMGNVQSLITASVTDLVSYHLDLTQQLIERQYRLYISQCKTVQLMEKSYKSKRFLAPSSNLVQKK